MSFAVFVVATIIHAWLLSRFVRRYSRSEFASPAQVEGLNQLLLSGSGGVRLQLSALSYLVRRKYAEIPDAELVKAGDLAAAGFWISGAVLIVWAVAMMLR